ncbi:MAG TPA: hypothetical protein DIT05_19940 [Morganella sp. (in: Bacteria)]|nr:hypothetical protein [Morganella sp. (in: enterobacteria)]
MEFTIKGNIYRTGKLNAFAQQDLAFALVPAFGAVAPLLKGEWADLGKEKLAEILPDILPVLTSAVRALGKKEREEINSICLNVVSRKSGDTWSQIYSGGTLMYDDINGIDLFQIVGYVIKDSLGSFFPELPATDKPD